MAAHTYWRLYIGAKQNLYAQMGTVSFLNAAQVNQSTGGTATASSEYDGSWAAGNAFDGNPASEWASTTVSSSEWIAYQHPSPVDVVFVGVKASASYPVSGLALQYSDDGVSWSAASPLYLLAGQPALTTGSYTVLGLSASRRPLVVVDGRIKELPEGDTLPPQAPAAHSHANAVAAGDAGFMTGADKSKLDGIAANANNYTHPANHPPSIITQDASNRFVTDAEKAAWNAKAAGTHAHAIADTTGLQAALDAKLGDAPSDGKNYGRKDGAWTEIAASSAAVGDTLTTNRTLSAPSWLLCDGSAYLQSSYAALYAELGLLLNTIGQTKLASPGSLPAGTSSKVAYDTTASYLAISVNTTPFINVYSRSGTTFTKLSDPATLPANVGQGVCVDGGGEFFAVAHITYPYVTIYQRSGSTLTKLTNPSTLPTSHGRDCACSTSGEFLYVSHDASPYITAYQRSGTTYTKLTNPAALPGGNGLHVSTDSTGTITAVATSTVVTVYERSGTTLTKLNDITPGGTIAGVAVSPSGGHVAITQATADFVKVYERSGSTFTALKSLTTPTKSGGRPAWSADGRYLCAGAGGPTDLQPCVFQLKGRRLSPATGVLDSNEPGGPICAAFGNAGEFLTVGHSSTPFITTYRNRDYDPATSFAVPNVAIENGLDTYMRATA